MKDSKWAGAPEKNTTHWKKNEKLINENPVLKRARDIKEGIDKPKHKYGQTHGGKGSATRIDTNSQTYYDNFDRIFKQGKYAPKKEDVEYPQRTNVNTRKGDIDE